VTEGHDPNFDMVTGAEWYETHYVAWVLAGGEPIRDIAIDAWIATVPGELG
jgi:hypothetical protein